jgi:hypothetical protein
MVSFDSPAVGETVGGVGCDSGGWGAPTVGDIPSSNASPGLAGCVSVLVIGAVCALVCACWIGCDTTSVLTTSPSDFAVGAIPSNKAPVGLATGVVGVSATCGVFIDAVATSEVVVSAFATGVMPSSDGAPGFAGGNTVLSWVTGC